MPVDLIFRSWEQSEDVVRMATHLLVERLGLPAEPPWTKAEARELAWELHITLQAWWHVQRLSQGFSFTIGYFCAEMCKTPKQLRKAGYERSVILR